MTARLAALWRSDVAQTLAAIGIRLGAGLASYLLFAVAARVAGPDAFGVFSAYFSAAMLAGWLGSFGQQTFLVKEVPRAREAGDAAAEYGLYLFAAIATVLAATVAAVLLAVIAVAAGWGGSPALLAASFLLAWTFAASQTTMGALRVQNRVLTAMATRDLAWRVLSIAGLAIAAGATGGALAGLDATTTMTIVAVTLPPMVLLHLVWVVRHVRGRFAGVRPRWSPRAWLDASLGMALIAVISSADLYAYTLVLTASLTSIEVGAFFASLKTVELLNLFLMAVTLVLAPELSRLAARGDAGALQRKCNAAILLQGAPAVVVGVLMLVAAGPLLRVFAPEYAAFTLLFRLLVLGMLTNALTGATVLMLQLGGLHWVQVGLQGGALALGLALLPWAVGWWGPSAAGLAFLITKGLWNVAAIVAIRRRFGVDPSLAGLARRGSGGVAGAWSDLRRQMMDRVR